VPDARKEFLQVFQWGSGGGMLAFAAQNRVREVPAVAVFTFFVVIGALVVLLVAIPGLADLFDQA